MAAADELNSVAGSACSPSPSAAATRCRLGGSAVADEFGWEVDWEPFADCVGAASQAAEQSDYAKAIENHGQALSMAIGELKKRKTNQPLSDSSVDL